MKPERWGSPLVQEKYRAEKARDKRYPYNNNNNNNNNNLIVRPYNRNTEYVECKNKSDTSNNRGDWDYFKVIQKIREQHTRKPLSQETTENSHIGHCTHTAESTNVTVQ